MTLKDSISAISSPGSADGLLRCVALDGQTVARHGQRHAPASLSARQAKGLGLLTSGTYGPPHIGLSASVALSWFLASNLAALTRTTGSTLYKLTWKPWAMPSGRLRFRLRASARRTRETVLIGWPTPIASNGRGAGNFNRQGGGKPSDSGVISWLAHANDHRQQSGCGIVCGGQCTKEGDYPGWRCQIGSMADTNHEQRPLALSARSYADTSRQWNKDSEAAAGCSCIMRPGPVNGFWRDADWLHGQDGWWRPVRPGSFPLANGVPARVGRVRTYGNAINIEAAAAFIKSYMAAVDHV
ncbi:C-5 cytosine-specific DNA methylase [Klebsiella pneumoniae]|nr:C-5 cytosine-specific DNA methylase [Klebsiella pneumoniae]SWC74225.1 C-5 cytosine-specific DNA methylase [Klebsiella pneumoniae]SWE70482.1 C-5 cytosine-specific DNA methylase [Klebsiella pneumoniae]